MEDRLQLLRYNMGADKKAFVQFKANFDAVIFNATIVAYSGASIADLVSMHKNRYIIDPQTHIYQQSIDALTNDGKSSGQIKKSVAKYLNELPSSLSDITTSQRRQLRITEIQSHLDELVESVYGFQTCYIKKQTKEKEYDKYLDFAGMEPQPRLVIAPYFMLKESYTNPEVDTWLHINNELIQKTVQKNKEESLSYPIAAQLVIEKKVLTSNGFCEKIKDAYANSGYEYIFIWIDDFYSFESKIENMMAFANLIQTLNKLGKKPIMAYGGYDSIILCNAGSPYRLYGVAQSVGYGEYRPITPVGGGIPVNKYYFLPLHQRMKFDEASAILGSEGYFDDSKSVEEHAKDYYRFICDSKCCHEVIGHDINNFDRYNDSIPYQRITKAGVISRNRPTSEAELIAAFHFLYCKVDEWERIKKTTFNDVIKELHDNYEHYLPQRARQIAEWCSIYAEKT